MIIIYDVDTLGERRKDAGMQTGVFRVVETIAKGIAENPSCEPIWYANHYLSESKLYIDSKPDFKDYPFLQNEEINPSVENKIRAFIDKETQRVDARRLSHQSGLMFKTYHKLLTKTHRLFSSRAAEKKQISDKHLLAEAGVFHSTWWKPPENLKAQKHIRFFHTVYDLIPILFPQYVGYNENYPTKRMIESMDEESWGFSISQSSKNDLCDYNPKINPDKILVTPLAAARGTFYPCVNTEQMKYVRQKYKIPEAPYFLGLSTLAPHKNITHLIRSFINLIEQQKYSDLYLVLVGAKGWEFDDIFTTITEHEQLKSRIVITGRADEEDLSALYTGSLGFVFMSLYEGFGLPPLEAMQCGVPVICSNTSSLPEVVGDAGILLDPKDEDGLCQAMLNVYNNANLRQQMSVKSLAQAAKFSWDKCVRQTIQGYRQALP